MMFEAPLSQEKLEEILSTLRSELEHLLGDQLDAVYLYGSQARGDARPGSDINILIVLKGDFNYFEMIDKTSNITAPLSLDHDVVISSAFASEEDFENLQVPFLMNVRREGIKIGDESKLTGLLRRTKGKAMLAKADNQTASLLKQRLEEITPVRKLVVYGSRARGEATSDSDLDVFIEVEKLTPELRKQISETAWAVSLERGLVISTFVASTEVIKSSPLAADPILKAIESEGVLI